MDNVLVISNFNAGRKKAVMYKKELQKYLMSHSKKFKFISIDEFDSIDISKYDTIIAIGGDGTVNKAAEKIINTDKTLICLPSGTANLLASNLGMTNFLKKNLKIIERNKTKLIDVIKVNDKISVLRIGLGYDSDIICKTPQSLKNKLGYFAYFIAGIIFALRLTTKKYNLHIDGEQKEIFATGIIIANAANMYKNIISIGNNSAVDDEFIDLFILKTHNPILFFIEFLKIIFSIRKSNKLAEYKKCKYIQLQSNWLVSHIDGEKQILKGNTNIKIMPAKLKVLCK